MFSHLEPTATTRDRLDTTLLLHEALARSRMREFEADARAHALARPFTAGRRWAGLARFASRRAERARLAAGSTPPDRRVAVGGLSGAV